MNMQKLHSFNLFEKLKTIIHGHCVRLSTTSIPKDNVNPESNEKVVKVAVIGVPNAGKSTFINNLIDHRVCPTSNKVHTTRKASKAICTRANSQIVLFDTPGLVTSREVKKHSLEASFESSWKHSIQHSNLIGVVHDVSNSWTRNSLHPTVLASLEAYPKVPSFLVLNKIDLLKSKRILLDLVKILTNTSLKSRQPQIQKDSIDQANKTGKPGSKLVGWSNFSEVFMISSLTGSGLDRVMDFVLSHAKTGPWEAYSNKFTDQTPESLIVQSVRARLLDYLPQEIPYLLQCDMDFYNNENGKIFTCVQVTCPSSRIERLVVGESNGKLRQITERVSSDLVETFGVPISLTIITNVSKKKEI